MVAKSSRYPYSLAEISRETIPQHQKIAAISTSGRGTVNTSFRLLSDTTSKFTVWCHMTILELGVGAPSQDETSACVGQGASANVNFPGIGQAGVSQASSAQQFFHAVPLNYVGGVGTGGLLPDPISSLVAPPWLSVGSGWSS